MWYGETGVCVHHQHASEFGTCVTLITGHEVPVTDLVLLRLRTMTRPKYCCTVEENVQVQSTLLCPKENNSSRKKYSIPYLVRLNWSDTSAEFRGLLVV